MSPLRLTLIALLVASTAVFAVGAIAESSQSESHGEPAAQQEPAGTHDEGGEEAEGTGESRAASEQQAHVEQGEELLGVDTESTPLIVMAVIGGLGLAAAAASSIGRRTGVLVAIALVMGVWTALDVREVVHQLDESRAGIAVLAMFAAALHLIAAVIAGVLAARTRHAGVGSTGRTGTMPA